jgi:hypothetical protein
LTGCFAWEQSFGDVSGNKAPQPAHAGRKDRMTRRTRKFIGAVAMVGFVLVYALIAMALAQARPIQTAPGPIQALIYVALGAAWILPLMPLIKWMEKPDRD